MKQINHYVQVWIEMNGTYMVRGGTIELNKPTEILKIKRTQSSIKIDAPSIEGKWYHRMYSCALMYTTVGLCIQCIMGVQHALAAPCTLSFIPAIRYTNQSDTRIISVSPPSPRRQEMTCICMV